MTVEELIVYGKQKVHSTHAKMLLADLLNKNAIELMTCLNEEVKPEIEAKYREKLQSLQAQKPLQYVIGNVNFYGYTFKVDENVLIPRFETEELVENTLKFLDLFEKAKTVIDLGCGSGAIGLTLKKKKPDLEVTLVDISPEALQIAQENAITLEAPVTFVQSDMWNQIEGTFDVIISNPPYIKEGEPIDEMVQKNEPALALYGGPDGLNFYRKIIKEIKNHIKDSYLIAFEIGESQKEAVEQLLTEALPEAHVITKKDLQNRDRMVFAYHF